MSTNLIGEIAKEFISGTVEITDIITFVESSWGLNIKLLPVQKFILKCLYGMKLDDGEKNIEIPDIVNEHILYRFNEKEFLAWLYAEKRCNVQNTEGQIFQELILAIGRRGTKSTLSSCISNYEMYKLLKYGDPSAYYGFPPSTVFAILNVAPNDDTSSVVFEMTQTMAMRCPYMKDRSIHQTKTYFDLQTDPDQKNSGKEKASLLSLSGGCSSNGLRGRNAIVIIMDEMAHFIDNNGRFSGGEVYKALKPSLASFRRDGKMICISSPYAKFGKFYERFTESFKEPALTLTFKMYSAMVNPTIPTEILKAARKEDRTGFMCEYGGEFSDTITAWIEDEHEFKKCVATYPAPSRGVYDVPYFYGLDLGFKNDGSSVAIVHKDHETNKIVLDYANVWYSKSSDVWEDDKSIYRFCNKYAAMDLIRMNDIVAEIKELVKWFPAKSGVFDQNNGYALAELFLAEHLAQFEMENFSEAINSEVYQTVKRLYAEELLVLFDHPVLIPEMLTLEGEKRAKEKVIVRAPGRKGAHDDISDAYCRAVWQCYNGFKDHPKNISSGAGGRSLPSSQGRVDTQASFIINRLKQHGQHPRGLYNVGKRRMLTIGR